MKIIDLRSDTVTKPTDKMRDAISNAIVGDDVYGDDPTVRELEDYAAQITGMEAALLVPSGTFGNQVSILTHTNRGDEIIVGYNSHIKTHEVGGAALISGVMVHTIEEDNLGCMPINKMKSSIRTKDIHHPDTTLICLENAHGCGKVIPIEYMKEVYNLAKENNIKIHLDGARLFNAASFLGVEANQICKYVDSVQFCLSKGLAAPIGSIIAGSKEFITKARRNRKMLGGGMRQSGIIAAAGLISLKEMIHRLHIDHQNAAYLREQLQNIDGIEVDYGNDINMVFYKLNDEVLNHDIFVKLMKDYGIIINGTMYGQGRFVTHNDVTKEDINYVVDSIKHILIDKK